MSIGAITRTVSILAILISVVAIIITVTSHGKVDQEETVEIVLETNDPCILGPSTAEEVVECHSRQLAIDMLNTYLSYAVRKAAIERGDSGPAIFTVVTE